MIDSKLSDHLINEHFWIPFTPNRDFRKNAKLFTRAQGLYYFDQNNNRVLDGVSGLFTSALGHGREEISEAIYQQLQTLDFTASFFRSHPGAFSAAKLLSQILPNHLNRIFFVNSGSEAVESALKVALSYYRAKNQGTKHQFVSRERAYHGVNFGGVALSGLPNNRRQYAGNGPVVTHMRHTWLEENRYTRGQPQYGAELADDLLRQIELHGAENIAACIVEPIAGSTGVLIPPVGYLERLRQICTAHDILLIFDEVICGFGRTGKAFATQTFKVQADIITLAKALTNGVQPMGAIAVSQSIYETITNSDNDENNIEFYHGYTWSAHPVACAAAIATLNIYQTQPIFENGDKLSEYFLDKLFALQGIEAIRDIRGLGLLGGIQLKSEERPGLAGYRIQKLLFDKGLHIKSTGDTLLIAPILTGSKEYINEIFETLTDVLIHS